MNKNIRVSSTRISTFLACKQKYWFSYYGKYPKVSNPSFKLGTAVHETLELAGNIWIEKGKFSKADVAKILDKYNEVSIKEGIEDHNVHLEGIELVKNKLNNFAMGKKTLGLELKFGFRDGVFPDMSSDLGVPLMGAIDKVEEIDEDTIIVIDYKTSKSSPTPSQLKSDVQLSLYDLVIRKMYPSYKRVILALDMLKSEPLYTYRTDEQRSTFERYLREVYDQMLNIKEAEIQASLNMFCPWCDFKDYCSTYQRACKKSDYKFLSVMNYTDEQIINEWESVKSIKKILENREKELSMVMMEKININASSLRSEDSEIYIRQSSRTNYDVNTVSKIVPPEDFVNLVTLNKKAVEEYITNNPSIKSAIESTSSTNFTTPFLSSKKTKAKK